jgi:hypothetical protein
LHPKELNAVSDASESKWVALAMKDGALFHMLLVGSVMFIDLVTRRTQPKVNNRPTGEAVHLSNGNTMVYDIKDRRRENPDIIYHMSEAIRLINNKLSSSKSDLSDATVLAVVFLAKAEVSSSC